MKKLTVAFILGFIGLTMQGQKVIEKNIDYNNRSINLDVKFASNIEVKTWDKSTVYFKAIIHAEDEKFIDLYELDVDDSSSWISITSNAAPVFDAMRKDYVKNNPGKKNYYFNTGDKYKFNYVLYVTKNAKFKVKSINGDLTSDAIDGEFTADLINGDIKIASYSGNLDLKTINGAIDLKIVNVDLVADTIHGDIYADDRLNFKSTNRHVGQKISGSIGNGHNKLRLNTINGNMYLR